MPVGGEQQFLHPEERAVVEQRELPVVIDLVAGAGDARNGAVHEVDAFECLFDMQFAWFTVGSDPSPVADAVGGVAVLLDLQQKIAGADGMDAAGGDEIGIAGEGIEHLKLCFDIGRVQVFQKTHFGRFGIDPGEDRGSGGCVEDIPHFGFRFGGTADHGTGGGIGMDLKRHSFFRVEQFDQNRKTSAAKRSADKFPAEFFHQFA